MGGGSGGEGEALILSEYDRLMSMIHGRNPYDGFVPETASLDGVVLDSGANVGSLQRLVSENRPRVIIEIGSWRGSSAINMARKIDADGVIVCVDTWLGSIDFIEDHGHSRYHQLRLKNGYPQVYFTFLSNVINSGQHDKIVPFPNTSSTAYRKLMQCDVKADMVYVDGSHEEEDVYDDISNYWNLLRDPAASIMVGDDYGSHDGVRVAVNRFAEEKGLDIESIDGLWRLKLR